MEMRLWLDDFRLPPDGWYWAKTVKEAKELIDAALEEGTWEFASLDHDLGACEECLGGLTPEEWLKQHHYESMPNCEHFGTGYTLICWMEEHDIWPDGGVTCHSMNPVGRARINQVIDKHYDKYSGGN
jgi:hypothetical protein